MVAQTGRPLKPLTKGKYTACEATEAHDIAATQALRSRCFGAGDSVDAVRYDARCTHFLIKDTVSGAVVCSFRLLALKGAELGNSYAAQFYDLHALCDYPGVLAELSRFCVDPDWQDPDILRLAWAAMTGFVDAHDVTMLFGCSSFSGVEHSLYLDAFAMLKARHLAPIRWMPGVKSSEVFLFAAQVQDKPDAKRAMLAMPPLLRTYLLMGGWVSDHAVIDHQMNTMHVFTGLEIGLIPKGRKRLLRALI
ncbi:MAG: GNAT family N-acetyltransferase [Sulfitobacter sp.]